MQGEHCSHNASRVAPALMPHSVVRVIVGLFHNVHRLPPQLAAHHVGRVGARSVPVRVLQPSENTGPARELIFAMEQEKLQLFPGRLLPLSWSIVARS